MKHCKYCSKDKAFADFAIRRASPDGLAYKCKECQKAWHQRHYAERADVRAAAIERAAEWASQNRSKRRAIVRKYDDANLERKRERNRVSARAKYARDPEAGRAAGRVHSAVRRHRMLASEGFIHPGVARRLLAKAAGVCVYCEKSAKLGLDHFHPISKGGSGQASNLVPCCPTCNSSKRDSDGPAWIERRFGIEAFARIYWRLEMLSAARLP